MIRKYKHKFYWTISIMACQPAVSQSSRASTHINHCLYSRLNTLIKRKSGRGEGEEAAPTQDVLLIYD